MGNERNMPASGRRRIEDVWFWVGLVALVAAVVVVVVQALRDVDLLSSRFIAIPLLLALFGAAAALSGWWRDRQRLRDVDEVEERVRERFAEQLRRAEDEARTRQEQLEASLSRKERELDERTGELSSLRRAHHVEKQWNRELREEVIRMQQEMGTLGSADDVPALVLRVAVKLLGAEKGLLLSARDGDGGDEEVEVVAWTGFDSDPRESEVAKRFARRAIDRDATVREDDRGDILGSATSAADREIRNLVAIPMYILERFLGVVVCANRADAFREYDDEVLLALGDHAGAVLHQSRQRAELRRSYVETVRVLADAVEAKDGSLRGHCEEMASYARALADRLGLDRRRREDVEFGALMHDIGKILITERILLKPAALSIEEYNVTKLHPRIGFRLLENVPGLEAAARGILHHHERFDGTGYPSGLRGEEIPLEARIIAVADAFNAMTSDRPYRDRRSVEEACDELERAAGGQFDPEIVAAFVDEVRRRPPHWADPLATALADPEMDTRLGPNESMLGLGSIALTDNLTLLYSRRYLHETAAAEAQRASLQNIPFAVTMIELTSLPGVNAHQGYAAGDVLIQRAARAVEREAAAAGGIACRYSGARLAVLLPEASDESARELVQRLREELKDEGARVVAAVWQPGQEGDEVIERARRAVTRSQLPTG